MNDSAVLLGAEIRWWSLLGFGGTRRDMINMITHEQKLGRQKTRYVKRSHLEPSKG